MTGYGVARCNPYGHATDRGPKHLLGGIYGPEYEGHVKWECPNPAAGRFYMQCETGHRGPLVDLCIPHVRMITRRQSGLCTRCAWPPEAIAIEMDIRSGQNTLRELLDAGAWESSYAAQVRRKLWAMTYRMDELVQSGRIRKRPLRLIEAS